MNVYKLLYWIAIATLTAIMLLSVYNYFFNHVTVIGHFQHFGYPEDLIYPLAIAKLFGLSAIWGNFSTFLKEWAYAGFLFYLGKTKALT
ncbi:DoxX family protein [Muriicola sp. Z0-33]|uniref:DoxX family protein n=1 Tax=Muriicola sp. Z0-33 TaxID=2816957 RepID=UPI002237FD30|nr:DoxX family protein [Muriicola sp. Z0-33]MCW5514796.1 DoxX family protein [Muriicola sp. Z0-33]